MKKSLLKMAAIAIPTGVAASTFGVAGAATRTDVTNATISCGKVVGLAKFAPRIVLGGTSPENVLIKLDVRKCSVSGVAGVTVRAGKAIGVLHYATNDASMLTGTAPVLTGNINIKWKSTSKLTFKESSVAVKAITGGTDGTHAFLSITAGNAAVAGDFSGTDAGASSSLYAETTETVSKLTNEATPPSKGIREIDFGSGMTHLTGNSLDLG